MPPYPPEQVIGVVDADARSILSTRALADPPVAPFRWADALRPLNDTHCLVLGMFGGDIPICLDPDTGAVVGWTPWVPDEIYLVNSSLRAFVDSLDAARPEWFSRSRGDDDEPLEAEARMRDALAKIDPAAVAEPDGFWDSICWDIGNGCWTIDHDDGR